MIRYTVHFTGHVQGVGFRYTCCQLAENCVVAGYVMNLPDRRVKLVAEGDKQELDALLKTIRQRMNQYITDVKIDETPSNGEFGKPDCGTLSVRY
jgi:acylphosphatase